MKIHTNTLSLHDLHRVLAETTTGVWLDRTHLVGSRSRHHGWDVALESDGTPDKNGKPRRFRRNGGTRYADESRGFAASYDDWGYWLAALFEIDPDMIAGPYKGRDNFHAQTQDAYRIKENA